jgi:Fe-S cluster biogenesis protein NfuA
MSSEREDREMHQKMQTLDQLISEFQSTADPAAQAAMKQIVQTLLEFHAIGLREVLQRLSEAGEPGNDMIAALATDKLISSLLLLHDLHPDDVTTRVRRAIERVQPYLASHGGHAELVSVNPDGTVQLRLEGSCHGCPGSRVTLQSTIEQEICDAAPEVTSIVVEGLVEEPAAAPSGFVPVGRLGINGNRIPAAAS